jgi:hypothetical protein
VRRALVGAVAVLACGGAERVPAASSVPDADVVPVRAEVGSIAIADTLTGGWRRVRVIEDSAGHILVFYRVVGSDTVALGGPEVGDSAEVLLNFEPGPHLVRCRRRQDGAMHSENGEQRAFVVSAPATAPELPPPPTATVTIDMHDFAYTGPERWPAGRNVIRVDNVGQEDHQVRLARLLDGVKLLTWLTDTSGLRTDSTVAGMARIGRGQRAYFEATLTPGTYVVYCLIPSADGTPHLERGMVRQITVQ